jgi:hypothetical protein
MSFNEKQIERKIQISICIHFFTQPFCHFVFSKIVFPGERIGASGIVAAILLLIPTIFD